MKVLKRIAIGLVPYLILGTIVSLIISQPVWVSHAATSAPGADAARLRMHVETLATASAPRNYEQIQNLNRAADYIHAEFAKSSAQVSEQTFQTQGNTYRNIIATFGPDSTERIVVGAHYDVYGGFAGADDNASGIAGLLELSRLLSSTKLPMKVELVAFTLEEPPFFRLDVMGSMKHASALKKANVKVRAMLCLEMIGYFTDKSNSQDFPVPGMGAVYPTTGNFVAVVGSMTEMGLVRNVKKAMLRASDLPVRSINAPADVPGIDFSDHLSYWQQGYPAVMITDTSFYRNKNYHRAGDLPNTLDYARMAKVVDGVREAILEVSTD